METTIRYDGLPGFSATWVGAVEGKTAARELFLRPFAALTGARAACDEQLAQPRDWKALAEYLEAAGQRYGVPSDTQARLGALAEGKAVACVTAQQVGYLGGPLYTFIKAYHCTRLAAWLEEQLRVPVLPIFWLEGEDHDLAEVANSCYLDKDGEVGHVSFSPEIHHANFEVGRYTAAAETVSGHLRIIVENLGVVDSEAVSLLTECYAGRTLSDGMGKLLAKLLRERGLFIVDGSAPVLKRMAAPLWKRVLDMGPALHKLIYGRDVLLRKAGFPTPLSPTPSAYLFYLTSKEHVRKTVSYDGVVRGLDGDDETVGLSELRERITAHPEYLSPKAALRPLYQDFVLPTVACVASPIEVAYQTQIQPFYTTLSVVPPTLFPRLSVTLMGDKEHRLSRKVGLDARKILKNDFDTLARRLKKNHAVELTHLRRLYNALKPRGQLNEQGLSTAYFLLRFGPEKLLAALDEVPLENARHVVISVSELTV